MLGWRVRWLLLNWRMDIVLKIARYQRIRQKAAVRSASS